MKHYSPSILHANNLTTHTINCNPNAGTYYIERRADELPGVFTIKQDTCVGCNMCSLVCPVDGCISMKQMPSTLPKMSWKEYQKKLAAGEIAKSQPPEHV